MLVFRCPYVAKKKPRLLKVSNVYIGTVAIEELIAQCEKFDG